MNGLIDNSADGLAPKTEKSNIPTKKPRKKAGKSAASERAKADLAKVKDAQIVFGFDNGATRNDLMHRSIRR